MVLNLMVATKLKAIIWTRTSIEGGWIDEEHVTCVYVAGVEMSSTALIARGAHGYPPLVI